MSCFGCGATNLSPETVQTKVENLTVTTNTKITYTIC